MFPPKSNYGVHILNGSMPPALGLADFLGVAAPFLDKVDDVEHCNLGCYASFELWISGER